MPACPDCERVSPVRYGLALLAAVVGTCCCVVGLTRCDTPRAWLQVRRLAQWHADGGQYQQTLHFVDFEERLLLDELPHADYSHGGVYFFGASNVKVSIMPWELPPAIRSRVGNYGVSSANFTQQRQFIEYLIQHRGLLRAGSGRVSVVFGLFYGNAVEVRNRPNGDYFPSLFQRHGLFTYSDRDGIRPVETSALRRWLVTEKAVASNFLRTYLFGLKGRWKPQLAHDAGEYAAYWSGYLGSDWQAGMASQMGEWAAVIDSLLLRGVRVTAVLLPLGSWHGGLPYPSAFREQAAAVCGQHGVPLVDCSSLLPDDEFQDSTHPNLRGQMRLHRALEDLALRELRAIDS